MKRRLPLTMAMVLAMAVHVAARELPIRAYTAADGLADNRASRIVRDSRGLLWICTNSGISRFDGSQFQSFGVRGCRKRASQSAGLTSRRIGEFVNS